MTLTASHRDLDLDLLEQLGSGARSVGSTVVADSPEITGCVVLATCNRFEVYLEVADRARPDDARLAATDAVARVSGLAPTRVAADLRARTGPDVARHLFTVASGLDSMVVGEREVAGQVRRALRSARADGTTSAVLERLFQTASRASRTVGSRTGLGGAGRSVVGVALDLAGAELRAQGLGADGRGPWADGRGLSDIDVLLVGTGSYAGASLSALRSRGARRVAVYSPSGRAAEFAADRGATAVPAHGLTDALAVADLVVSCSGATGPVIDAAAVAEARSRTSVAGGRERGPGVAATTRPTVLVDLALRHDVAPDVAGVPGVSLIDLATVQRHAPAVVGPAVAEGLAIVGEQAARFEAGLAELTAVPAVVALRGHVAGTLEAEIRRARSAARGPGPADPAESAELAERALRRFAAALLHTPAVRAREHARTGRHAEYRDALETVFGITVPPPSFPVRDAAPPETAPPDPAT